jgi:tetratricopeptide (TPR) repeat protein
VTEYGNENGDPEAAIREAAELRTAGHVGQARERFLELAAIHPYHAGIAYQTAWTHDVLGLEAEAVPHYERALAVRDGDDALSSEDRAGAFLGLASTYRVLGRYAESLTTFDRALTEFPGDQALRTFRAMVLYNLGESREAIGALLKVLAATSADEGVRGYRKAIEAYADDLDGVVVATGAPNSGASPD